MDWSGKNHKVLVSPGRSFYGVWHQKFTLDNHGDLYLFYSYTPNQLTEDEWETLKLHYPFQSWTEVEELQPPFCVHAIDPRCWLHPMPDITNVVIKSMDRGGSWTLLQ
jgi:hypothetical protein